MPNKIKPFANNRPPEGSFNKKNEHQDGSRKGNKDDNRKYVGYQRANLDYSPNPYAGFQCKGNLGLLFTRRYYDGINKQVLNKDAINVETTTDKGIERDKTNHQAIYYRSRNNNIILQAKKFVATAEMPHSTIIELTTTYPGLLTGTGILHGTGHEGEAKLGLMFDHTTGLPYLPGSSVKGLLRSLFPMGDIKLAEKYKDDAAKKRKVNNIAEAEKLERKADALLLRAANKRTFIVKTIENNCITEESVDDLELSIFNGIEYIIDEKTKEAKQVNVTKRDIFFDAFPIKASKHGLLGIDFITPHTKGEFSNPTPIQFMRIEPDVTFRFEFRFEDSKKNGETICTKNDKKKLFKEILTTIGIGAKTNVGYGQLIDSSNTRDGR